jgi:uncharacterized protein YjiS (DUF1127 family)
MRPKLSCSALNFIAAHQSQPPFSLWFWPVAGERTKPTKPMLSPFIRFIQKWKQYGRDVQELSFLSDRELADIGITRCDIRRIAREQSR